MPPFNVSRASQLNSQLGLGATAKGFVNLPIYTVTNGSIWEFDLGSTRACNYINEALNYRMPNDTYYSDHDLQLSR